MTVAELIEKLRAMPQDAVVWAEGCDCNAPCGEPKVETYRTWIPHLKDRVEEEIVMFPREDGTKGGR